MITSNPDKHDYDVYIDSCDMESGKLPMPSKVKPYRIFSVHKSIIVKTIGRLDRSKSEEVIKNIKLLISLKQALEYPHNCKRTNPIQNPLILA